MELDLHPSYWLSPFPSETKSAVWSAYIGACHLSSCNDFFFFFLFLKYIPFLFKPLVVEFCAPHLKNASAFFGCMCISFFILLIFTAFDTLSNFSVLLFWPQVIVCFNIQTLKKFLALCQSSACLLPVPFPLLLCVAVGLTLVGAHITGSVRGPYVS